MKEYATAIALATLWGIVRNIFAWETERVQFLRTTIGSGLLWVLAFWLAPYVTSETALQFAFVYVSWMLAPHIAKIAITKLPILLEKWIEKKLS